MSFNGKLPDVFSSDVTSVSDYKKRIKKIQKYCGKAGGNDWKTFFRGDRYCAKTQSNFFRYGNIEDEAKNFEGWKKLPKMKDVAFSDEFEALAYMQHYQGNTRLLDFTKDCLVALRFACGAPGDNCRKKVTIYRTNYLKISPTNIQKRRKILESYLRLIKGEEPIDSDKEQWKKDIFVEIRQSFPRIKRQEGLFLLMGNFTTEELLGNNTDSEKNTNKKVIHELSPNIGRGENYPGYVGVLAIDAGSVEKIRNELEQTTCYRMDYLMTEENENENEVHSLCQP